MTRPIETTPAPGRRDALRRLLVGAGLAPLATPARAVGGTAWSAAIQVYPAAPPDNATTPSMITDTHGNSVAVWYDVSDSGSLQGATLAAGAFNASGEPAWVPTSAVAASNVVASFSYDSVVGMDAAGDAMAVWTDGVFIYVARLAAGGATWSTATIVNTPIPTEIVADPSIAVAANGNAVAVWSSSAHPYDITVFANAYDASISLWRAQVDVLGGPVEFLLSTHQLGIDAVGDAVIAFSSTSNNAAAATYDFAGDTWTPIASTYAVPAIAVIAVDAAGNATFVALQEDDSTVALTLPFNQTAFASMTTLSTTSGVLSSLPAVAVDSGGSVVAVWPDATGGLASARLASPAGTWNTLPTLPLSNGPPFSLVLGIGAQGNAIAAWVVFAGGRSHIQSALLAAGASAWTPAVDVSAPGDTDQNPQVVLTARGDAIAMWQDNGEGDAGTIESAALTDAFAASPAALDVPAVRRPGVVAMAVMLGGSALVALRRRKSTRLRRPPDSD